MPWRCAQPQPSQPPPAEVECRRHVNDAVAEAPLQLYELALHVTRHPHAQQRLGGRLGLQGCGNLSTSGRSTAARSITSRCVLPVKRPLSELQLLTGTGCLLASHASRHSGTAWQAAATVQACPRQLTAPAPVPPSHHSLITALQSSRTVYTRRTTGLSSVALRRPAERSTCIRCRSGRSACS